MSNTHNHETWAQLLHSAVHTPGKLLATYTAFHNYSFGNALLALTQCRSRNLEQGPLNTYRGWLELKRQVRKGEKGITLCMPMQYKKLVPKNDEHEEEIEEVHVRVSRLLVCLGADGRRGNGLCADPWL